MTLTYQTNLVIPLSLDTSKTVIIDKTPAKILKDNKSISSSFKTHNQFTGKNFYPSQNSIKLLD